VATISRLLKIIGLFAKEPYKRDDIDTVSITMMQCVEYRVAKTYRMPYLDRSFSAKEPY